MNMAVFRVHKNENYTVLSNYHFKEKGMSLKAKGLLSLMLSLPENWDYSAAGLVTLSKDGKDSVNAALKELEKFGYLKRSQAIDERGKFSGYNYEIFEKPIEAEKAGEIPAPLTENPSTEKPTTENPQQLSNKELITEILSTEKIDKIDKSEISPPEPNSFTKKLIEINYIEPDDISIGAYNKFFKDLINDFDFEIVRSCLWYFINRYKTQPFDETGGEIENKLAYLKAAMLNGAQRLDRDNNKQANNGVGAWLFA